MPPSSASAGLHLNAHACKAQHSIIGKKVGLDSRHQDSLDLARRSIARISPRWFSGLNIGERGEPEPIGPKLEATTHCITQIRTKSL